MRNNRFAKNDYIPAAIALVVGVVLLVINVIRILNIPITIDETGVRPTDTYVGLMQNKIGSANNHILHSLFRKFFIDAFGKSLFSIRLDNLIAQVFFMFFSYLLCRRLFKNSWWLIVSFLILNLASPLIFDFWGLSRGYGLALTFMTISIFFLSKYMVDKRALGLGVSFVCAILSVYSNFGYINYFLVLSAVVLVQNFLFGKNSSGINIVKELMVICTASGILAVMIYAPLTAVYHNGELVYMGNHGFIKDTIRTVVYAGFSMMSNSESLAVYNISRVVIVLTGLSGLFWAYTYFRSIGRKELFDNETKYGITFFMLLIGPVISMIAQHKMFGINYLTDRAALFFIILFMLQLTYLLYYLRDRFAVVSGVSFAVLFLLTIGNFCAKLNLHTTVLWYFNAADMAVLNKINNESTGRQGKIKIGVTWLSEPSFNYDIENLYPDRFYPVASVSKTQQLDTSYDYLYLSKDDIPKLSSGYYRDTDCTPNGFVLFKKKG